MTDPRTVTISYTPQEARELAQAARAGNGLAYVDHGAVHQSIERLEAAAVTVENAVPAPQPAAPAPVQPAVMGGPGGAPPT